LRHVGLTFEQVKGGDAAVVESFRVAQLASTSSAAQAIAGMAARFAGGDDALAAVVRQRQDLARRWERLDSAILNCRSHRRNATQGPRLNASAVRRRRRAA
jgi:hypothetical protein